MLVIVRLTSRYGLAMWTRLEKIGKRVRLDLAVCWIVVKSFTCPVQMLKFVGCGRRDRAVPTCHSRAAMHLDAVVPISTLFIVGRSSALRRALFDRVLRTFNAKSSSCFFGALSGVVTLAVRGVPRNVQIILTGYSGVSRLLDAFDLDFISCGFDWRNVCGLNRNVRLPRCEE